jgi:hypothetical protein
MWKRVMDGVQGRVTRFRTPGGVPDSRNRDAPDTPDEAGYRDQPMPVAAAILWTPRAGSAQGLPTIPIFFTQRALAAVQDHAPPASGTSYGLLAGDLFRARETGAPYVLVESTIRLPATGDAKTALLQGWVVAQDVLRKTGDQLVGWYRVIDAPDPGLSAVEIETHAALFPQPWQLVLAVGSGEAPSGGVYRPAAGGGAGLEPLAFHEVLDDAAAEADGTKRTRMNWTSYRSAVPTSLPDAPPPPLPAPLPPVAPAPGTIVRPPRSTPTVTGSRLPPLIFLPDQALPERVATSGAGTRLRQAWQSRPARIAAYAAVGLAAIAGSVRLFSTGPRAADPPPAAPALVAPPLERLDRAADTLALALAAFDLRARLFATRQMQCPELARGLVLVEERWTSYNAVRKESGVALDSIRAARDQALYADADGVERRFERSVCPRP